MSTILTRWARKLGGLRDLEADSKARHTEKQQAVDLARANDVHPRQHLIDDRDEESKLLTYRREQLAYAERVVARHRTSKSNGRQRLSEHFYVDEFDTHDGTPVPASAIPALRELCVHMLEPLRAKYGPVKVVSGYRHRAYNARIGGAKFSQHIYDDTPGSVAADLIFEKGGPVEWARSARWRFARSRVWRGRGGCGRYIGSGFIHVDSASRRDWEG
ncbi:MAG: hypothetical protein H0W36_02615 [Gemmatimonadetes bacterium]|nr:hypothetical protein [Gemmatimonadota bacterium]